MKFLLFAFEKSICCWVFKESCLLHCIINFYNFQSTFINKIINVFSYLCNRFDPFFCYKKIYCNKMIKFLKHIVFNTILDEHTIIEELYHFSSMTRIFYIIIWLIIQFWKTTWIMYYFPESLEPFFTDTLNKNFLDSTTLSIRQTMVCTKERIWMESIVD